MQKKNLARFADVSKDWTVQSKIVILETTKR